MKNLNIQFRISTLLKKWVVGNFLKYLWQCNIFIYIKLYFKNKKKSDKKTGFFVAIKEIKFIKILEYNIF